MVKEKEADSIKEVDHVDLSHFKDDFATLIEAGFIAVKQSDERSARQIFKAAHVLNPESTASDIGLGYIAINKMHKDAAIFHLLVEKDLKVF